MVGICFSPVGSVITAAILGAPTVGTAGVAVGTGATIAVEAGAAGAIAASGGSGGAAAVAGVAAVANPVGLAILGSVLIVGASETPELYKDITDSFWSDSALGINYLDIM